MKTFLNQTEATFYHITTIDKWPSIQKKGIISESRKIFVSRVGEPSVLFAIATQQLPDIYTASGIVILKFPQSKNNFQPVEIIRDNQADEWTKDFQNIILRDHIPTQGIELVCLIKFGIETERKNFIIDILTQISNSCLHDFENHSIFERANQLKYD